MKKSDRKKIIQSLAQPALEIPLFAFISSGYDEILNVLNVIIKIKGENSCRMIGGETTALVEKF